MATAGEGATSYGGGGGGKFRKKPFRRHQATPYDRPPTALRNPNTNGWLSKLVDPASKLMTASAHMLFSSVFRKRLPPIPQPPPEANQEPRDGLQVAVTNNCSGACEPTIDQGGNLASSSDGSGISDLEQILKQKTFTRSEIDHLTELLRSRTVELPAGNENKWTETNISKPLSDLERHEEFTSSPVQENRNEWDKSHGVTSTPVVGSRVLEEDIASPAELAKAYMGSRPSKVSPSMLGLRSQALREDATLLNNASFPLKSPMMSLAPKTAVRVGAPENGFTTPRSRGRSAIYSMARTPYSRVLPVPAITQKGTGSTNYGFSGPSSSQRAWEHDGQFGSKQVQVALKRRSSVLDDDIGSIGAIRRIRQKSNLSSQGSPGNKVGSNAAHHHVSSTQKLLLLDEAKHKVSKTVEGNGDSSIPSTSYAHVPSKSSEMAAKILQHLDRLSPKEKSSESKLVVARDKSPTKLTPNMLSGKALRSLEDVDSSKFMQNEQESHKLEDSRNAWLPDARDSTSRKQEKVEENGAKKFSRDMSSSMNSDSTASMKNAGLNVKTADSVLSKPAAQPPPKKRAFQMSAHEDSLELDEDIHSNGFAFTQPAEGREKWETSVVEVKAVSTEAITLDNTPELPEVKTTADSVLNKRTDSILNRRTDSETYGGSVVGGENSGFTFPTSAPSTTFQPADLVQSTPAVNKFVPPKDPDASPPLFSSSSKNVDKVPLFKFSPSYSANEISGLKSGFQSDPKPESSNSLVNVALGTPDAQLKILEEDKGDIKNSREAGDKVRDSRSLPSVASTSESTNGIFSFGAPAKNSNINNGSLASSPSIFSSTAPVLASSNFSNQIFNNLSAHIPSSLSASTMTSSAATTSTTTTTTAFSSAFSLSVSGPSFPAAPIFNFGSSSSPLSTVSTSGAETTDTIAKTKEATFDNVTSSPFGGTSFAMASSGSSPFGFSSAVASSTANNHSQDSLFGTGSGSLVIEQAGCSGTGVATSTQSMSIQFGSSGSSPVFGTSGITSFTSGSSLFGGPSFDHSSSSSLTKSVSSTSGATSSTFGSSWKPINSPISGASFSSPSAGFSFGASSSSVAATNSAPMVFGSSTGALSGPMFSFTSAGATTSSLPSLSQAQPLFGNSSPLFGAIASHSDQMNMEDSMAEDPVQASTPAVPVFGQPESLPPSVGFVFGSTAPSPSLPFQFGGQQNQSTAPQNPSPFPASSSLDFSAGGSFSLGSGGGGGDKSGRRIVRVNKSRNRKK